MSFQLEKEMAKPVQNWLNSRGYKSKAEFITPWGICDFVAVDFFKRRIKHRLKLNQFRAISSLRKYALLMAIPDVEEQISVSLPRLARQFTRIDVKAELEAFCRDGFVVEPRKNHFQKINGWFPLHRKVIAIETKLQKNEDAIFQASNNLKFASESYVAFPYENILKTAESKKASIIKSLGLGLIGVGKRNCKILIRSRPLTNSQDPLFQNYFVERFWKNQIKDN